MIFLIRNEFKIANIFNTFFVNIVPNLENSTEHYRSDLPNYVDDSILYNCENTFLEEISDLETTIENLFDWFCHNNFEVNPSKCHEKALRLT